MRAILTVVIAALLLISAPCLSPAAPLRTYVSEFSVTGAANRDELKLSLQGILASRLDPDQVRLVESADRAELLLSGSYALFGKMFSLDVLIKNTAQGYLGKVYEQGDSQDDLLPAMGRLARKITQELAKSPALPATSSTAVATTTVAAPLAVAPPQSSASAKSMAPPPAAASHEPAVATAAAEYIVKPDSGRDSPGSWTSAPLEGVLSAIALGRRLPSGDQEIFITGERTIRYLLRKGTELKQVGEVVIPLPARILAIDSADLDHNGTPELYVTIVDRESLSSRVYQPTDKGLILVADSLPWFLRGFGNDFKQRRIMVQAMASNGEYFNGISELVKTGSRFEAGSSRALPRGGNIFNFTMFRDRSGTEKTALLDEDGYLVISGADGGELWRSSDKFGGSETYFKHESLSQLRSTGDGFRRHFLEQRMVTLADGTLLVPRNEGIFSIGNNRSFSKYSLFALQWNGALFKEAWHTRLSPGYLADFAYDPASRQVVLLEVIQKAGLFSGGKTVISVNSIETAP